MDKKKSNYYDYIIVGAGPAGLALTQCLRHTGKRILLLEGLGVLGGCHRVVRVPYKDKMLFTEHGPRVYNSNFLTMQLLLRDMGHDFYTLFTPYRYSVMSEFFRRSSTMTWNEYMHLTRSFLVFLINPEYGKDVSVMAFTKKHGFSKQTIDLLDRTSRMSDGIGIDRYTLQKFFQLLNQQLFYKIYQPKLPNDKGLLRVWKDFLVQQPTIEIATDHDVVSLGYNQETGKIVSVWVLDKNNHNTMEIKCDHVILAVPPKAMVRILRSCVPAVRDSFMPFHDLEAFANKTAYIPYISITYHWKTRQSIPIYHGFPTGEWGIIFIVLSDYMDTENEQYSQTLISCCVSYTDRMSVHTQKSANQSSAEEVMEEVLRQLREILTTLEKPDASLLSPESFFDNKTKSWRQYDVACVESSQPLANEGKISNLFNVGTQNGNTDYALTSIESAVANAVVLAHRLCPKTRKLYPRQDGDRWTVRHAVMSILLLMMIILVLVLCCKKNFKNKKGK